MTQVTKSTMIGELLQIDENIAPILLNIGMHCLGCPSSQMETIEEAAMVHGIEPDALVKEINDFLAQLVWNTILQVKMITSEKDRENDFAHLHDPFLISN